MVKVEVDDLVADKDKSDGVDVIDIVGDCDFIDGVELIVREQV